MLLCVGKYRTVYVHCPQYLPLSFSIKKNIVMVAVGAESGTGGRLKPENFKPELPIINSVSKNFWARKFCQPIGAICPATLLSTVAHGSQKMLCGGLTQFGLSIRNLELSTSVFFFSV